MQVITYHLSHAMNEALASFATKYDTSRPCYMGCLPYAPKLNASELRAAPGTTGTPPPPQAGVGAHGGTLPLAQYFPKSPLLPL
jgi:hypothetical protein